MKISLQTVQDLAPDQASLNAAKKLLNPAKWPLLRRSYAVNCIWGQCRGSGANPYHTVADVVDHGYKCTCPSRKFPCKHVLALLWQYAEKPSSFALDEPPDWVNDWLGRRRKSGKATPKSDRSSAAKRISLAGDDPAGKLSPEEAAKKAAATHKRALRGKAKTAAGIHAGLEELLNWIDDQLRTGIGGLLKELNDRCRRIAARMVDAKATNLASRLDELPAKLFALEVDQRAAAAMKELGQLVLLTEAWFANPDDPDARRAVAVTENREQVLDCREVDIKSGTWEMLGEKVESRRDGLVSHASWLINVSEKPPGYALLQDYYPASAGKRGGVFDVGQQISGELVYYPSRSPLRAFFTQYEIIAPEKRIAWGFDGDDPPLRYARLLRVQPWLEWAPCLLGEGRILTDGRNAYWWRGRDQQLCFPLTNKTIAPVLLGGDLQSCFILWDGERAELFSAWSRSWGRIVC